MFTGLCFLCAYCSVFEIMINYNILNGNNMQQQQRSSMRPKPPSLAQLKRWTWGKKSVNCRTNLALCCAKCHVLSLYVLFGQFSAYFPIPYSLELYSRLSYVKSNCNTVELLVIGNLFTTTAVKPCLNKFYKMKTNFLGFTFYFNNGNGKGSFILERERKRRHSRWVRRECYWVFTLGEDKDHRKKLLSLSLFYGTLILKLKSARWRNFPKGLDI